MKSDKDHNHESPSLEKNGPRATVLKRPEGGTEMSMSAGYCEYNGDRYPIGSEICVRGTAYLCLPSLEWEENGSC